MNNEITDYEVEILYQAIEEYDEKGYISILCPRCNKKLIFNENGNSYQIHCEDPDCIKLTFRGI